MPRTLHPATAADFRAAHVVPYLLVDLDYAAAPVRVTSLPFDFAYDGKTFKGVGRLGKISPVQEGTEVRSYGVTLEMSGIPLEYARTVRADPGQWRTAKIWVGTLNANHRARGEPVRIFTGWIDTTDIELGATCTVTVALESRLLAWERAPGGRFTDAEQQRRFPGDKGLEYVAGVSDMQINWGRG